LKAIAVASNKCVASLPQVPTFIDGGLGDFRSQSWYDLLVRAGTLSSNVDTLNVVFVTAMKVPAMRGKLKALRLDLHGTTAADFGPFIQADLARYSRAIELSGAKIE